MRILKKGKKKKGFTLIELIAVVAILIILAVILIPNVIGYMNKSKISKVKSDAKVVLDVIKTAQSEKDDDSIKTYADAITEDSNIEPTSAPSDSLKTATVSQLEDLIRNDSKDWKTYSSYYSSGTVTVKDKDKDK